MSQTGEMTIRGGNSGGNRSGVAEALRRAGRRAVVAAAALGVLLAGSGCGGNGDANAAADPTAGSAATATQEATGKCSAEASVTEILDCLGYEPKDGEKTYVFNPAGTTLVPATVQTVYGYCNKPSTEEHPNSMVVFGVDKEYRVTEMTVVTRDGKNGSVTDPNLLKGDKLAAEGRYNCGGSVKSKK